MSAVRLGALRCLLSIKGSVVFALLFIGSGVLFVGGATAYGYYTNLANVGDVEFDVFSGRLLVEEGSVSKSLLLGSNLMLVSNEVYMLKRATIIDTNGGIMVDGSVLFNKSRKRLLSVVKKRYKGERKTKVSNSNFKKASLHPKNNRQKNSFKAISVVIIDPGHGGKDPGAIGVNNTYEKVITRQIAKLLYKRLLALGGVKVYYTFRGDRYFSLDSRTRFANNLVKRGENPIFVSIHANASVVEARNGFETYYLSDRASDRLAMETASIENSVIDYDDNKKSNDVSFIISRLLKNEFREESRRLAKYVQNGLNSEVGAISKNRGVKRAMFYVLRGVDMPSILVETGFITNRKECRLLKSRSYQMRIARGIAKGIKRFIKEYNKTKGFTR